EEEDPHRLARCFLSDKFSHMDGRTLRHHRAEYWSWADGRYREFHDCRAAVVQTVYDEFQKLYAYDCMKYAMARKGGEGGEGKSAKPPRLRPVTCRLVADVMQALSSVSVAPWDKTAPFWVDAPFWVKEGEGPPDPLEVLAFRNGL